MTGAISRREYITIVMIGLLTAIVATPMLSYQQIEGSGQTRLIFGTGTGNVTCSDGSMAKGVIISFSAAQNGKNQTIPGTLVVLFPSDQGGSSVDPDMYNGEIKPHAYKLFAKQGASSTKCSGVGFTTIRGQCGGDVAIKYSSGKQKAIFVGPVLCI